MIRKFWSSLRRNWPEKIMALLSAVLLYMYVNAERNPVITRRYMVNVRVTNVKQGYEAVVEPSTATITVTAQKQQVDGIFDGSVRAEVDLGAAPDGRSRQPVRTNLTQLLRDGARITVTPSEVDVRLLRRVERTLPVECLFANIPQPGYAYQPPIVSPSQATVVALEDVVYTIRRLVVNAIPSKPGGEVMGDLPIIALDERDRPVANVTIVPSTARVSLQLAQIVAMREVPIAPVIKGRPAAGYVVESVTVTPAQVVLRSVGGTLPDEVRTEELDVSGAENDITRPLKLRLPSGVLPGGVETVTVTVRLSKPADINGR